MFVRCGVFFFTVSRIFFTFLRVNFSRIFPFLRVNFSRENNLRSRMFVRCGVFFFYRGSRMFVRCGVFFEIADVC